MDTLLYSYGLLAAALPGELSYGRKRGPRTDFLIPDKMIKAAR